MDVLRLIVAFLRVLFGCWAALAAENLTLRQQLIVLQRSVKRPQLRDRDGIYGEYFRDRVEHMGIEEVLIAPRSPWQNPYCERLIGSVRRECLDHVIVLNEDHLRRTLSEFFTYYHESRTHLSLDRNSPIPRSAEPPAKGKVVAKAYLGGLHHRYTRAA